jgi:hypothetical protein
MDDPQLVIRRPTSASSTRRRSSGVPRLVRRQPDRYGTPPLPSRLRCAGDYAGRLPSMDAVMVGFGGGPTWGAAVVKWMSHRPTSRPGVACAAKRCTSWRKSGRRA